MVYFDSDAKGNFYKIKISKKCQTSVKARFLSIATNNPLTPRSSQNTIQVL